MALRSVPDDSSKASPQPRKQTTSFMIPTSLKNKAERLAETDGVSLAKVYIDALLHYFNHLEPPTSWATVEQDGFYDPDKVYAYGEDKKGHSATVRLNIPKTVAGKIGAIVRGGQAPQFSSETGFYRNAIYHAAYTLAKQIEDGELEDTISIAAMISEEMRIKHEREESLAFVEAVRANAEMMIDAGDWVRLKAYLSDRTDMAQQLPETMRDEFLDMLNEYKADAKRGELSNERRRRR